MHGPSLFCCKPRADIVWKAHSLLFLRAGVEAEGSSEPGLKPKTVILTKGNNPINAGAEGEETT